MKYKFIKIMSITLFFILINYYNVSDAEIQRYLPVTIGIVVPVDIPAMMEITNGFKDELNKRYPGEIHYLIKNAHGDINVMRSILQQFKIHRVNLIIPIGTTAAQMAASFTTQPIVALAAEFKDKDRLIFKNKNITNILDEVNIDKQLYFIHRAFPKLKYITLIYDGANDHIFSQVQQALQVGNRYGIKVQKLMISELRDLYTVSRHINSHSQAILVLKDARVVSGISTLIKLARQQHLLLITSDDGSVQKGADIAVGVSERAIGISGAKLAARALKEIPASQIPVQLMTDYHVYISLHYQHDKALQPSFRFNHIKQVAKQFNYPLEIMAPQPLRG